MTFLRLALFIIIGNLMIVSTMVVMDAATADGFTLSRLDNFRVVDNELWRGGAPDAPAYRQLADNGVTTIVDLRAESHVNVDEPMLDRLGLTRVSIPIRDGQTPSTEQVEKFLAVMKNDDGIVYVHCGAGVGRTGSMVAAYLVSNGASPLDALKFNLSVGPPSLEQISYMSGLGNGDYDRPNPVISAISRILDGPRRISKYL
jgi:protein tyrosine/serine phosphatase